MNTQHKEPVRYPATPQDRVAHLIGLFSADQQINAVLQFAGQLEQELLEQAVQLTIKLEPILGCRFIEADTPYWEPQPATFEFPLCSLVNCHGEDQLEADVRTFLTEPGDRAVGPMVQTKLFRTVTSDTLGVKLSHLCSDGGGVKEYVALLAAAYTLLAAGQSPERTETMLGIQRSQGFREQGPVFAAAGIEDITSVTPSAQTPASLWAFPSDPRGNIEPKIALRRFNQAKTAQLIRWTKARQATVNDVLVTAFYRSLARIAVYDLPRTATKAIGLTVDLRRYLPGGTSGAISNLSAVEVPVISLHEKESFEVTLGRVKEAMNRIKHNLPGISSAAGIEQMAGISHLALRDNNQQMHAQLAQTAMAMPMLTNFGIVAPYPILFGGLAVEEAYMTAPIMNSPYFLLGASSYHGALTLSIGFHTPAIAAQKINQFLDDMAAELNIL